MTNDELVEIEIKKLYEKEGFIECRSCLQHKLKDEMRGRLCMRCIQQNGRSLKDSENEDLTNFIFNAYNRVL